jgi:hypothetical protein
VYRPAAIALLLTAATIIPVYGHSQNQKVYDQYVYLVKASDCAHEPKERALTGFRVHGIPGIITALHGVADSSNITVTSVDGKFRGGSVAISKVDIKNDLALLSSPELVRTQAEGLEVAPDTTIAVNTKVYVVGYPLSTYLEETKLPFTVGEPPFYELGKKLDVNLRDALLKRNSPSPSTSVLFLVGPLHPGHSGAPVLDSNNRVIAVANGSIRVSAGYGWAIPYRGITWKPAQANVDFHILQQHATNIALFSFDENPQDAQERITRTLEAIRENTARLLMLQSLSANKDRLEILRDYVPRIADKNVRFSERCIALAESINASVFQDTAAFEKAAELMEEKSVPLEEQRIGFPQLVDALAPLAPKHLDFIAREFATTKGWLETQLENGYAITFWWYVFQKAIADYPEVTLAALSDTSFAAHWYREFDGLCANLPEATLEKMESYPSRSTRGLAALQRVYRSNEEKAALPIILDLIDAETNDDLQLASQVLAVTNRKAVIDVPLAERALKIVKNDGPIVLRSSAPAVEIEDRGRESRFWAAEEYMVWSSQFQTISKALEKPLLDEARLYEATLQSLESNKPENGNGDLYARACIRALISLNKSMYGRGTPLEKRVSPDVQDALQRTFGHSSDLLWRVNINNLAEKWELAVKGQDYDP